MLLTFLFFYVKDMIYIYNNIYIYNIYIYNICFWLVFLFFSDFIFSLFFFLQFSLCYLPASILVFIINVKFLYFNCPCDPFLENVEVIYNDITCVTRNKCFAMKISPMKILFLMFFLFFFFFFSNDVHS